MPILDKETTKDIALDLYDSKGEIGYRVKRGGASFLAKRALDVVGSTIEMVASSLATIVTGTIGAALRYTVGAEIARDLGAFAGAIGGKLAGFIGIGFAAGISAAFTQMDYVHEKNNIKNTYKNAIAKHLDKSPDEVTMKDVEQAAKTNHILDEELQRARRKRNFNVPVAMITTLASFAAVTVALPLILDALALPAMGMVASIALKGAVSIASYFAVKTPLKAIGDKVFDLSQHTSCDHIHKIAKNQSRGKTIEPEQVVGLIACADTSVAEAIQQAHGKPYEALTDAEKTQTAQQLNSQLPVQQITEALNNKSLHAAELILLPPQSRHKLYAGLQEIQQPKSEAPQLEADPAQHQDPKHSKKTHVQRIQDQSRPHAAPHLP